jgi:hypothetical protein
MSLLTLFFWMTTAGGGLFLLSIWLIEYDEDTKPAARSRREPLHATPRRGFRGLRPGRALSGPLIAAHVLPAGAGIVVWVAYLIFDFGWLAWLAVASLAVAVSMGLVMATRWIGVYRAKRAKMRSVPAQPGLGGDYAAVLAAEEGPAERHFPLLLVLGHGLLAVTTVTLVVLITVGAVTG